jgi:hypothetical protein
MSDPAENHALANPVLGAAAVTSCSLLAAVVARLFPYALNWDVLALSLAGFGTLTLAGVTFNLVSETARGRQETHKLAALAAQDEEARIRPAVMLWHDAEWFGPGRVGARYGELPFLNAGAGPALNVQVQVYWRSDNVAFATTSIGPGEKTRLFAQGRIGDEGFEETWGRAVYSDVRGQRWETRFVIQRRSGSPQFQLRAYGLANLLPDFAYPKGWDYDEHGLPVLRLPPGPSSEINL